MYRVRCKGRQVSNKCNSPKLSNLQKRRLTRAITNSIRSLSNAKLRRICSVQECFFMCSKPRTGSDRLWVFARTGEAFRVLNRCPRNEDSRPTSVTHKSLEKRRRFIKLGNISGLAAFEAAFEAAFLLHSASPFHMG